MPIPLCEARRRRGELILIQLSCDSELKVLKSVAFEIFNTYSCHEDERATFGRDCQLPMKHKRLLSLFAHRLRIVARDAIYLAGCAVFKPYFWMRRRLGAIDHVDPSRILYVCMAGRGDLILALPSLIEIRQNFPEAHITCWVRGYNRQLAGLNPAIDDVFIYDDFNCSGFGAIVELIQIQRHQSLIDDIQSRNFTLMIDDSGTGFTTLMGMLARIKTRIGRNSQGYGFLNHFDFARDANCQLVQKRFKLLRPLGIVAQDQRSVLNSITVDNRRTDDCLRRCGLARRKYFTVQPHGGWRAKDWPPAYFTAVMAKISRQTGLLPVLLGSNLEKHDLDAIGTIQGVRSMNLAGELELDELAAVIAGSAFHLGVDSIGSHIACAVGIKSLTIFGPTNPLISHSFSERNIAVFKRTRCTPKPWKQYCCFDAGRTCSLNACMNELQTDEVLELALDLLQSRNDRSLYEL